MNTLAQLGEREAIRRLARHVRSGAGVITGIGDDCALARLDDSRWDLALTTDPVIEGIHFLPDTVPERIGHKAAGRCLSDIAAMGAEPLWALINVVAAPEDSIERMERIYNGATELCSRHGTAIIGGDLARGPRLELHVFMIGRAPRGSALTRSGARPGDALYVTGALGGSRAGKHLDFEPRLVEGAFLREGGWASAMIDLSDGIAADLRHILDQSRVGAELWPHALPLSDAARLAEDGRGPLEHALCDGEDFELLFTVPNARASELDAAWAARFALPVTRVGRILDAAQGLVLRGADGVARELNADGYQHFSITGAESPRD
ncbi:MAG: thiamine-phosphate kinase [Kiritimatiellae bacterium]|nr:thiamine-phosphate kinase [Kiritimatiellia bacterium]